MTDDRKDDGQNHGRPLIINAANEEICGKNGTDVCLPKAQWPLFKKAVDVTVEIDVNGSEKHWIGAGVVISKSGLVITAWHVVRGAKKIRVRRLRLDRETSKLVVARKRHVCDLVYADHKADIAVLKLRRPPLNLPVAALGDSDDLEKDDPLYRVGCDDTPIASGYLLSFGKENRLDEITVGMPSQSGSSGGPIFGIYGRVVAIALRTNADEKLPPCSYAVPINVIKRRVLRRRVIRELLEPPT
ncbi:MAG: serine protease [Patescibacteria group bacterium]|jgi:S1-C subfamily serine protease